MGSLGGAGCPGCLLVSPGCLLVRPGCLLVRPGCLLVNLGCLLVNPGCLLVSSSCLLVSTGCLIVCSGCLLVSSKCLLVSPGPGSLLVSTGCLLVLAWGFSSLPWLSPSLPRVLTSQLWVCPRQSWPLGGFELGMEQATVWDSQAQAYVSRKRSREEPVVTNGYGVGMVEEEEVVGDQMVEMEPTTIGTASLEEDEDEECRVAGFYLQGKKVISTGFTARKYGESPLEEFRVLLLGSANVGKTSLFSKFFSPGGELSVDLCVDEEETRVSFIESRATDNAQLEFLVSQYRPDGFLILTSLIDETSIDLAERLLGRVSRIGATLLIGNKADLVKKRRVKQGALREMGKQFNVKYIETSPDINHHVDEALVSLVLELRQQRRAEINLKRRRRSSIQVVGDLLRKVL